MPLITVLDQCSYFERRHREAETGGKCFHQLLLSVYQTTCMATSPIFQVIPKYHGWRLTELISLANLHLGQSSDQCRIWLAHSCSGWCWRWAAPERDCFASYRSLYRLGFFTKWRLAFKGVRWERPASSLCYGSAGCQSWRTQREDPIWRLGRSMFRDSELMYWIDTEKKSVYCLP